MSKTSIGFAMCGSFCTFSKAIEQMKKLISLGYDVLPIMSYNAGNTDTRFGKAEDFKNEIEDIAGKKIISSLVDAEPIGPKKLCDLMLVCPCTGNTLSKISLGITDTPVTLAVKSHLRVLRPVVLCVATNDALSSSGQNIARLINTKNIYFVPMRQDDCEKKPNSLVADFDLVYESVGYALRNKQHQPIFI